MKSQFGNIQVSKEPVFAEEKIYTFLEIAQLVADRELTPGKAYNFEINLVVPGNPNKIIIEGKAVSTSQISPSVIVRFPANHKPFGAFRLEGTAGSVNNVTVNSVNLMSASVPFATSLSQTCINVANNINAGTATHGYTAYAIAECIVLEFKDVVDISHFISVSTTTLTVPDTSVVVNNGIDPNEYFLLKGEYFLEYNALTKLSDGNGNTISFDYDVFLQPTWSPMLTFRYTDPAYHQNTFHHTECARNFVVNPTTGQIRNNQFNYGVFQNNVVFNDAQINHNNGINRGIIASNALIRGSINNNIVQRTNVANLNQGIISNMLIGNGSVPGVLTIGNNVSSIIRFNRPTGRIFGISFNENCTIESNRYSNTSTTTGLTIGNNRFCVINSNVITITNNFNTFISNNENLTISGNSVGNQSFIRRNRGMGGSIQNCTLFNNSWIEDCVLDLSQFTGLNLQNAGRVFFVTMFNTNLGFLFLDGNNLQNAYFSNNNWEVYRKIDFNGTSGNGLQNTAVALFSMPLQSYNIEIQMDGSNIVLGAGAGTDFRLGFEKSPLNTVDSGRIGLLANLNNTFVGPANNFDKVLLDANKRYVFVPIDRTITSGSVWFLIKGRISQ